MEQILILIAGLGPEFYNQASLRRMPKGFSCAAFASLHPNHVEKQGCQTA